MVMSVSALAYNLSGTMEDMAPTGKRWKCPPGCECGKHNQTWVHRSPVTHGMSGHPLFKTWRNMVSRCENTSDRSYRNWGARGIKVCEAWRDPRNFVAWIEQNLGPRPGGMTLDRIDNDGNYEPGNVRWATSSEQRLNSRKLGRVINGRTRAERISTAARLRSEGLSQPAIARVLGISQAAVWRYLQGGDGSSGE